MKETSAFFLITLRAIVLSDIVSSNTHLRWFTCSCSLIFISLCLLFSSSTSFKLRLELNKIDFVLSSPKYLLSFFVYKPIAYIAKVFDYLFFYFSEFLMNKYESSAYRCKLDYTAWLISLTWIKNCGRRKFEPSGTPHEIFENFETWFAASKVKWRFA